MVAGLFLVERTSQGVNDDRNRVRTVIVHDDDGQTNAQIIQSAIDVLNVQQPVEVGAEPTYPALYFDAVVQIAAAPEGPLATIDDLLAFAPEVLSVRT